MNEIPSPAALRLLPHGPAGAIVIRSTGPYGIDASEWEDFAGRCGASHHCLLGHVRAWRFLYRVRLFEVFRMDLGWPVKIGQCAVAIGRRSRRFLDRLQMLPGQDARWQPAMAAILRALGPGLYRYGSNWNIEPARQAELQELDGVRIEHVDRLAVQAVDFSGWADWEDYLRQVSSNARRNAKRATQAFPDRRMVVHERGAMLGAVHRLTWLRLGVCRRKRLEFRILREGMRAALRAVIWRQNAFIACFEAQSRTLAMFSGIQCGGSTYYLEGASREGNEGASWWLMLAMLRQCHQRNPHGRFVMGVVDADPNLSRSRAQCRVTDHPTSIVVFRYLSPAVALPEHGLSRPV